MYNEYFSYTNISYNFLPPVPLGRDFPPKGGLKPSYLIEI